MKTNLFVKSVSVLLSVIMIASIFTVLPTSIFAAEKDTAAVSAEADIAEVSALEFEEPQERIFVANSGETITGISAGLMGWNYTNTYFQWYRVTDEGDVAVEGATSDMFDAPIPDTPGDTYTYYCIVRRGSETARSYDHLVTRTTEWDSRYMSGPIEDIVLESSVRDQFGMYPNMTCDNFFTEVYRTNGSNYDDPVMVNCDYTSGYLTINDDEWQEGESRYYYIYFKPTSSLYFRSNVFKVTKPAGYDPTPNLNITVGTIFNPVPTKEAPSWRDSESEGIFQYKGARTYAYFFTPFDDKEHSLTDLAVTFYRCDNEDGTGNISVLGRAHADDLSAYPGVNDDAAFENDLKCLLPSDTAGVYYVYAEYTAAANGVSFNKTTGVTRVTVEDVSYEDYFRFDASTGTITGYYGCEDTIVYPAEIKGVKVKKIRTTELTDSTVNSAQQPFQDVYRTCRKAILPEGLEQIPEYTFLGEKFLEEANVPNSVTRINRYSFYRCARLKSVTVGDSDDKGSSRLSYIEGGAFCFSDVLEKLDFGNCGTNISSNVTKNRAPFGFLPALTEFIAPANAQMNLNFNTPNYPFNRSSELKQITNIANINRSGIPNRNYITVPHIFFMLRDKQETAEYDESFIYYPDEENEGWTIGGYLRKVAETDGELIFPDTFMGKKITRIGVGDNIEYSLFEFGNYPLRLVIGQYVKEIGAHAFEDVFSRGEDFETKAEVVLPASLTTIGAYAFSFTDTDSAVTRLGKVNLSDTSVNFIGEAAFKDQFYADFGDLVFHSDVTVEDYAFMISDPIWEHDYEYINHDALLSVTVDGSAAIGYRAFYHHNTLKSVSVSGTLTLDQDAFDKCYYIENVSTGGSDDTFGVDAKGEIIDGKIVDTSRGFSHFRYTPAYPEVTDTQPVQGYTDLNADHKQTWERTYKRSEDVGYYIDRCEADDEDYFQGTISHTFTTSSRINLPGRIGDDEIQIVNFVTLLDCYDKNLQYTLNIGDGINLLLNTTEYWHPYAVSAPRYNSLKKYYLENCCGISFPRTVKHIPSHFLYNAKLTGSLEIPATVEQIDSMAFADNEIDTLILHEGIQYIGAGAFTSGAILWSGKEPDSEEAFFSTDTAKYTYYHRDEVGSSIHYSDTSPKNDNVKHIITAEKSNAGDLNLLPDSLTSIDEFAFADCAVTGRLILPSGVRQVGSGAFYSTDISEVLSQSRVISSFGTSKEAYGTNRIGVFEDCKKLKKVDFSNTTITAMGKNSFAVIYPDYSYVSGYTTNLQSSIEELYLPNGLVTVGENTLFAVDPGVIHLPDTVTEYNVCYFPVKNDNDTPYTYNGKTLPELSITIPENTAMISRSLFNLGTVTFLNRDQEVKTKRESYGTVLTEDLPSSIPDYCTVRCYQNSFIYNWCVDNDINYELLADNDTLAVRIIGPDGRDFSSTDLQTIVWRDLDDDMVIDGERLYCAPWNYDGTHRYECEITFKQDDFNAYNVPRTVTAVFDPMAADFSTQKVIRLKNRTEVTVTGTFGEQAKLDGFTLNFISESPYIDTVYPTQIAADGSFTVTVPRVSVKLCADVAKSVHYMPLTLKNVAYRDLNDEEVVDLGVLSLAKEPTVPFFMLQMNGENISLSGTARLISADGENEAKLTCAFGHIIASGLDDFTPGDAVKLEFPTGDSSSFDYTSDVFTLAGTKTAARQNVELHTVTKPHIVIKRQKIGISVFLYNKDGDLAYNISTGSAYTNSGQDDVTRAVSTGKYTLIAVQASILPAPQTLQDFRDNYDPTVIAGYVEKEIEIGEAEEYIFTDPVPAFVSVQGISIDFSVDTSMMNSNGAVPMYMTYKVDDQFINGENVRIHLKITTTGNYDAWPLRPADGHYAVFSESDKTLEETYTVGGGTARSSLTIDTDVPAGTICMYVVPDGTNLCTYVNGAFYTGYQLPIANFSVIAPPEIVNSSQGELILTAPADHNYNEKRTIRLYVDDELYSETPLTNTGYKQNISLPYAIKTYADGASIHSVQIDIVDENDEIVWSGERYEFIHADSDAPIPTKMDIRITNENATTPAGGDFVDGVARVEYAALDLLTGEYRPMKYVVPWWYYNTDGTMEKDLAIDYYLTVDRPELVNGDITLTVYCCETSPYTETVILRYNENTGTYDGQLFFEGGTITVNDLPYGFDIDIPSTNELSYSEQQQYDDLLSSINNAFDNKYIDVELDDDIREFYETEIDIDDLAYQLDTLEYFSDLTAEEKQAFIDYALAHNDVHDAYENLLQITETMTPLMGNFNIPDEASTESLEEFFNALVAGSNLKGTASVPASLDHEMLKALGYTLYDTSKGKYYVRSDDNGISVINYEDNTQFDFIVGTSAKSAVAYTSLQQELAETGTDADIDAAGWTWETDWEQEWPGFKQDLLYDMETLKSNWLSFLEDGITYSEVASYAFDLFNEEVAKTKTLLMIELERRDIIKAEILFEYFARHPELSKETILVDQKWWQKLMLELGDDELKEAFESLKTVEKNAKMISSQIKSVAALKGDLDAVAKQMAKEAKLGAAKTIGSVGGKLAYVVPIFGTILNTAIAIYDIYSFAGTVYKIVNTIDKEWNLVKIAEEKWKTAEQNNCLLGDVSKEFYEVLCDFASSSNKLTVTTYAAVTASIVPLFVNLCIPLAVVLSSLAPPASALHKDLLKYASFVSLVNTVEEKAAVYAMSMAWLCCRPEMKNKRVELEGMCKLYINKKCNKQDENPSTNPTPNPPGGNNNNNDDDPEPIKPPDCPTPPETAIDPSGCVYEAVLSNRVEGATAEIYYKGDNGEAVFWDDAGKYDEINPQTTDQFGEYGWMTPIGKWKVVITKDGYEEADSSSDPAADEDGWLPVPPPQLNVDIPLVSKAVPAVENIAASGQTVAIRFSQYMDIAALDANPSLITITENGESVPLSFTFTDSEESPTQEGVFYGRILRIARTDGKRFSDSVAVSISKDFANYAGNGFAADFAQTVAVGQIPNEISHSYPNRLVMALSDEQEVCVRITDEDGAPVTGETVAIKALYGDLLTIESTTAVTDEDGVARFRVKGIRSGDELLTFTLDNGVKATMKLRVKAPGDIAPEKPAANLNDFAVVESGTELVLTCDTEGTVIYYTTDDTCPCQDTESRKEYTGPIKLTESGFYRIAAYNDEGGYSERINLHITVTETMPLLGDVDRDGEVEIRDATWIQRSVADIEIPFTIKKLSADVDGDGVITVMDATLIQYYLANMKNPYNIGKTVS